mmetsp:Transcript_13196/g.55433  ORF Transcript_13196/g.55433 Transcript_13196/m.55433 type:complete len:265 (+) Transcript_13196:1203-1997(+)
MHGLFSLATRGPFRVLVAVDPRARRRNVPGNRLPQCRRWPRWSARRARRRDATLRRVVFGEQLQVIRRKARVGRRRCRRIFGHIRLGRGLRCGEVRTFARLVGLEVVSGRRGREGKESRPSGGRDPLAASAGSAGLPRRRGGSVARLLVAHPPQTPRQRVISGRCVPEWVDVPRGLAKRRRRRGRSHTERVRGDEGAVRCRLARRAGLVRRHSRRRRVPARDEQREGCADVFRTRTAHVLRPAAGDRLPGSDAVPPRPSGVQHH